MSFCCHQFPYVDLYKYPITSESEVRPWQPNKISVFCSAGKDKMLQDNGKCCGFRDQVNSSFQVWWLQIIKQKMWSKSKIYSMPFFLKTYPQCNGTCHAGTSWSHNINSHEAFNAGTSWSHHIRSHGTCHAGTSWSPPCLQWTGVGQAQTLPLPVAAPPAGSCQSSGAVQCRPLHCCTGGHCVPAIVRRARHMPATQAGTAATRGRYLITHGRNHVHTVQNRHST